MVTRIAEEQDIISNGINESGSLGDRLRSRRERLELTLEDIAQELKTPSRYFKALEENAYAIFPAKVYAEGFLKKYLRALFMSSASARIMYEFQVQWEIFEKSRRPPSLPPRYWIHGPYVTSRRFMMGAGIIGLIGFMGLFSWQFTLFSRDPYMVIESPQADTVVIGPGLEVRGAIERESRLTVNGREIKIDERGNFDEKIELPAGRNTLEFLVENRFGRKSTEIRHIVMK